MNGVSALLRAVRWPIMMILAGGLFAVDHFSDFSFRQTWPTLLIAFGLLTLFGREVRPPYVPPPPGPPLGENR